MNAQVGPQRTVKALRERHARLTEASLLINASLDLDEVLRQIAESARVLTGVHYAFIVSVDEAGEPREFFYSGLTREEYERMRAWPDGIRLFEHLRERPDPVIDDITACIRELGLVPHPVPEKALYCTALRHRGRHVGYFFLGGKRGGRAFTGEDEESVVIFASQAGAGGAGGPGGHLADRRDGVRRQDRASGARQSRGQAHRGAPARPYRSGRDRDSLDNGFRLSLVNV